MTVADAGDRSQFDTGDELVELMRPWHPGGSVDPADYATFDVARLDEIVEHRTQHRSAPDPDSTTVLVVARRGRRRGLDRRLRRAGLRPLSTVIMVPRWPATEHLLSVGPSLADGVARHLGSGTFPSSISWLAKYGWGRAIMAALAPSSGVVAVWDPDTRASSWLATGGSAPAAIHVSRRNRADAPTSVALLYRTDAAQPFAVAKFSRHPLGIERLERERIALTSISQSAPACGIEVPTLLGHAEGHITMSTVAGSTARADLDGNPDGLTAFLQPALQVLRAWQHQTARLVTVDADIAKATVLDALDTVTAACSDLQPSADAIASAARSIFGHELSLVFRHGDLTVSNVLRTEHSIGFIDWESASSDALPLTDEWYLLLDALSVAHSCSHAESITHLLDRPVAPIRDLLRWIDRTGSSLGLDPAARDLAFHATWVGHASNEVRRGSTNGRFVGVMRRLQDRMDDGALVSVSAFASDDDGDDRPTSAATRR